MSYSSQLIGKYPFFLSIADVTTSGGNAVAGTDYTDATAATITFPQYDAAMTHTVALTADTILEGTECFNFIIALTSDAGTMAAASVSTNGDTAKIFIIDESCKCAKPSAFEELIAFLLQ